jgi:hypothetical protein
MWDQQGNRTETGPVRTIEPGKHASGRLAEVVVHIDEDLADEQREILEQDLRTLRGILDLSFCRNRHHLMIVQYQPEMVSSTRLIEQVRRLAGRAQLIGPI